MRRYKKEFINSRRSYIYNTKYKPKNYNTAKKAERERSQSKKIRKSYSTLRKSRMSNRSRNHSCRNSFSDVKERLSFTELNFHLDKIIINLSCSKYPVIPKIASEEFDMTVSNELNNESTWDIFWADGVKIIF